MQITRRDQSNAWPQNGQQNVISEWPLKVTVGSGARIQAYGPGLPFERQQPH